MEKTINELLDAYKKSYEAQSSLLKAMDGMINLLETHLDELKLELSQCKKDSMSYTGLTDEELEEIEKLTEETMKTRAFGILDDSKENTTTEDSDVKENKSMSYTDYLEARIKGMQLELDQYNKTEVRPQESFGEKVRLLRQERKLTMKELGEKVFLTESAIGMIERGERNPSFPKLCDIARFFKVDIDSLTDFERSSKGLTAKEREEIAKLSKEIMDQSEEESEWPDGL